LSVATFVTLLLVPVIYAIFVLDLKLVKWEVIGEERHQPSGGFEPLGGEAMARQEVRADG
jgi:hypothetical protein